MQNFNPDREESAAAAAKLNGAVLTAHTDGVMAAIRRELKRFGLGADLAVFAQTCEEFAKQANADMVCISSSNGDAVAAVTYLEDGYAGKGVSAVADMRYLMPAYRQYFNRPDKMVIFQGGHCSIYQMKTLPGFSAATSMPSSSGSRMKGWGCTSSVSVYLMF